MKTKHTQGPWEIIYDDDRPTHIIHPAPDINKDISICVVSGLGPRKNMTPEERILLIMKWRDQVIQEQKETISKITSDPQRRTDYLNGVVTGWHECINTLKLHDMLKGINP